jgi:dipeptidyl aminopeptidase/acylaminoacyl peptidase
MWFLIIGVFLFLVFLFACMQIAFSIVLPKRRSLDESKALETQKDDSLFAFYDDKLTETIDFKSRYGYNLKLYSFINEKTKKFMVISHGHTYTHHGALKYARMMCDYGYSVILYDQRFHGNSGGKNSTLGYYEKFDLYDIITWLTDKYGKNVIIGTYGESMGGATVLLEQAIDNRVKFCISDCAFSDLQRLIQEQIKRHHLPRFIYFFVDKFVKIITGISLKDVSPIKAIENSQIPILFIHGKKDGFINYQHSVDMYNSYGKDKAIFLADNGATHAFSYFSDKEDYHKTVGEFLERYVNEKI